MLTTEPPGKKTVHAPQEPKTLAAFVKPYINTFGVEHQAQKRYFIGYFKFKKWKWHCHCNPCKPLFKYEICN